MNIEVSHGEIVGKLTIIQIKKDQPISEFTELFKTAYENIH